nr:uncharacterized protein K02A2.6-like [Dermacentor andersoni]
MSSTSAQKTLEKLRGAFAAYGLPEVLVSDNGPQFTSEEFAEFMSTNGVKHVRIPPYHAASNGAAERTVQTVKRALLKQVLEREASGKQQTVQENIDSFLMAYRNTPSSVTSKSPAELFLRRQPRIKLSLLQPDFAKSMRDKQEKLKEQRDLFRGQERSFVVGDRVLVKTVRGERVSWEEGVVIQIVSAVTYMVKVRDQLRFTHADHLRPGHADPGETPPHAEVGVKQTTPEGLPADDRTPTPRQPQADQDGPSSPGTPADPDRRTTLEHDESVPPPTQQPVPQDLAESHVPAAPAAPNSEEQPPLRRGARVRRQPDWFRSEDFK